VQRQGVLQCYERALELTRVMLEAAQKSEWDGLVQAERERTILIDQIKALDPDPSRDATLRERKRDIIVAIMDGDEQIQLLTQDWMHELREVLGSISTEQRLNRTYGQ
jgi:hypothetical protein